MFLKSLQIRGFKSFADKALLELEPGITVVVGPNGSGKSNVVDAIAWVLGAQAPSSIRSQKMDDVIFAGTSKRPALGRAEVSLTIDNSAGLLPVEFSEVTVTRTLFRSGDSDYAINGVSCRLLDIQELLSDAGVGRNQHVIISQGQIDAILNARPEERRTIIEEAAGILKYRRRKERAERRLAATETDLSRVNDLQREIRRQLRPLEKQALAAERHEVLAAELAQLQRHLGAAELVALRHRLESVTKRRAIAAELAEGQAAQLAELDEQLIDAEEELRRHGGREVAELLARFDTARERVRGLAAVLAERRRGAQRLASLRFEDDPVAALTDEAVEVTEALEDARMLVENLEPERDDAAEAEATVIAEREALLAPDDGGIDPLVARAGEVRRELASLRSGLERSGGEVGRLVDRQRNLQQRLTEAEAEQARHGETQAGADAAEDDLARAVEQARLQRSAGEDELTAAEEALREVQAAHRGAQARVDVLANALDAARARAGAARLAELEGVVGTLLDAVDIDPGWEAAFEAAAGEALTAVVVDDVDVARAALELLAGNAQGGAVLPARQRAGAAGAAGAGAAAPAPANPSGAGSAAGEPLRGHVRGRQPAVDAMLDTLLAGAVRVEGDWSAAVKVAVAHPQLVVVTDQGDRFGPQGWRVGSSATGVTGAMLDDARRQVALHADQLEPARARLEAARQEAKAGRSAFEQAVRAADEHAGRTRAAVAAQQRAEKTRADIQRDLQQVATQLSALEDRNQRERQRLGELEALLPSLEAAERDEAARAEARAAAEADLDRRRSEAGRRRMELEVQLAQAGQRVQLLTDRQRDIERRLEHTRRSREEAERERERAERRLVVLERLAAVVDSWADRMATAAEELQAERRRLSDAAREVGRHLDALRQQRQRAERAMNEQREVVTKAELESAEVSVRLEALVERIGRELQLTPEELLGEGGPAVPELPEGVTAEARMRDLDRELKAMGPINPLAVEEYRALQERTALIEAQVDDVKESRRELQKVIKAIDDEISSTFAAAYADVAGHFELLFATLFPGGTGSLRLTDPDDLLNTGIDVEAKPSGKNVRKLSLLSGGERSLTALGLLFAIFRSRPSPFYVMDEVEAALDEVNLRRFLGLLEEFRSEAQLLVVSHQKRTMEIADCLYGVSMKQGESSRVVSEKLRSA
ncbi:MAG: chromosome segregation protein SMC [Acidimicrobiales bacterium]|nr:chromosome segregation protein SMC [Acidimicrobiales bacterium]